MSDSLENLAILVKKAFDKDPDIILGTLLERDEGVEKEVIFSRSGDRGDDYCVSLEMATSGYNEETDEDEEDYESLNNGGSDIGSFGEIIQSFINYGGKIEDLKTSFTIKELESYLSDSDKSVQNAAQTALKEWDLSQLNSG